MTTSDLDLCRLTVVGPQRRADLTVPIAVPVSDLLPVLCEHVAASADPSASWVVQRLGEDPLDPDGTPESLGLRHGDVLHLRPAAASWTGPHFDDLADGVAQVAGALPGRWRPELTRRLSSTCSALALAALAATLLGAGPGAATAAAAAALAAVLAVGCVLASRLAAGPGAVLTTGSAALAFGLLPGLVLHRAADGGFALGSAGVLVSAGCAVVCASGLLALGTLPVALPGTVLLTALAAGAGAGLTRVSPLSGGQAVAVLSAGCYVLGHLGPRVALRLARLRAPLLPHDADELQRDIDPAARGNVERRVRAATSYLDALSLASAVVQSVGFWYLAHLHGWLGWTLPLVLAGAVLLRARALTGVLQRVPAVLAGCLGLATVLVVRGCAAGPGARPAVMVVLLLAAAGLVVAAWRLPNGRLLPLWSHAGDLVEGLCAVALLPLVLQALHTYAAVRALMG